jgi:hypothetical protein
MIFTAEEKTYLLNRLPSLELSYEPKLHKKVYAPLFYVIPKGPKALLWYTYWKDQNVCLLIKLNERGNYSDVQTFTTVFSDRLALGTIIYGTYFVLFNRNYFTCEQLYYYKGAAVASKTYQERLPLLLEIFSEHVDQAAYTKNSLIVGLPLITETYEEALEQMDKLPYRTYGIAAPQHTRLPVPVKAHPISHAPIHAPIHLQVPARLQPAPANPFLTAARANFKVKAGLAADNYLLYTIEDTLYETAMVPTYKCSVMLNALFRNIKENANLDLLEESDDEEEFENPQMDKFVDLEKTIVMECVYSKRFKKWQPVKPVLLYTPSHTHTKIISLKELPKN